MYGIEITKEISDRFWAKVNILGLNDCWEWKAAISGTTGYGNFGIKYPKNTGSHRMAFFLSNGYCPEKILVMHSCDNRKCCNPSHLSLGTNADNLNDMAIKGRAAMRGEKAFNTSLTEESIKEIRDLRQYNSITYKDLGKLFGLSRQQISAICRGLYWRHVK